MLPRRRPRSRTRRRTCDLTLRHDEVVAPAGGEDDFGAPRAPERRERERLEEARTVGRSMRGDRPVRRRHDGQLRGEVAKAATSGDEQLDLGDNASRHREAEGVDALVGGEVPVDRQRALRGLDLLRARIGSLARSGRIATTRCLDGGNVRERRGDASTSVTASAAASARATASAYAARIRPRPMPADPPYFTILLIGSSRISSAPAAFSRGIRTLTVLLSATVVIS